MASISNGVVVVDSTADLSASFTGVVEGVNGGWRARVGGSTPTFGTGPGTNNTLSFVHTETSTILSRTATENNGILTFRSSTIPDGNNRVLRLRLCIQGEFGDGTEGLEIQERASSSDSWSRVEVVHGWEYDATLYETGNILSDENLIRRKIVADGGWVDFYIPISDDATEVRLHPRYLYSDDSYLHDIAFREFEWTYDEFVRINDNIVVIDSISDLQGSFSGVQTGTMGSWWAASTGLATTTVGTGVGTNNVLGYVYTEGTTGGTHIVDIEDRGTAVFINVPDEDRRIVRLRVCLQGFSNSSTLGLEVQERDSSSDSWVNAKTIYGWSYSNSSVTGDTITDYHGVDHSIVANGGWIDVNAHILDSSTEVRLRPQIRANQVNLYDISLREYQWSYPRAPLTVDAGDVSFDVDIPEASVTLSELDVSTIDDVVVLDSISDLQAHFSGVQTGNGGRWAVNFTGSTSSGDTGPGTNNALAFVHTETSGGTSTSQVSSNGVISFRSVPAGIDKMLRMRVCVQGHFGDGTEGLEIQERESGSDTWSRVEVIYGWTYSNTYVSGQSIVDENDESFVCAVNGGWRDVYLNISDSSTQVRLHPRYLWDPGSQSFPHDIAFREFQWFYTEEHEVDAGDVSFDVDIPEASVTLSELDVSTIDDVVVLDSISDLQAHFTEVQAVNNGGWVEDSDASTTSSDTGPGTNNTLAFVHTETSGTGVSEDRGIIVFSSIPEGIDRIVRLRLCIQGNFDTHDTEGLEVQSRVSNTGNWSEVELLPGWSYSDSYVSGQTITDYDDDSFICVETGGWRDFYVDIADNITGVRLHPRYGGSDYRHDIAFREFQWFYTEIHELDAGDVSFDVDVPEPTIVSGSTVFTVDAGDVSFDVDISDLDVTSSTDAGDVSFDVDIPESDVTSDTIVFTVDTGDVSFDVDISDLDVTSSTDAGDVSFDVDIPESDVSSSVSTRVLVSFNIPEVTVALYKSQGSTVILDSLADLQGSFTGVQTGTAGRWNEDVNGGTTPTLQTGPGSNNTLGYVFTEASGGSLGESNGIITFTNLPDAIDRAVRLRVCIQGHFGDGIEGLEIQERASSSDSWSQAGFIYGWNYADTYDANEGLTDYNNIYRVIAARGGWLDYLIPISNTSTQVRLHPRYIVVGSEVRHDIAFREFQWFYTEIHELDAGDVSFDVDVPEPDVTYGVDAGDVSFDVDIPEPTTPSRVEVGDVVILDSLADLRSHFHISTVTGSNGGWWENTDGGSTFTLFTGPSTDNDFSYVYIETSGSVASEDNGIIRFRNIPAGMDRSIRMRLVVQGAFNNGEEGLEIQERSSVNGTWTRAGFIHGWAYLGTRSAGSTFTDYNGELQTVVADGSWVDFDVAIADDSVEVRLHPQYVNLAVNNDQHDIGFREFQWTYDTSLVVAHRLDAGDVSVDVDIPDVSVTFSALDASIAGDTIVVDSVSDLQTHFTGVQAVNSGGWIAVSDASTSSSDTGPGTNNTLAFVHTETSGAGVTEDVGIIIFSSIPEGIDRTIRLRLCMQGNFDTHADEGLEVQSRLSSTGNWSEVELLPGWAYSNNYVSGQAITDYDDDSFICVETGGWRDFYINIADDVAEVRLHPRYGGSDYRHDIAFREFQWFYTDISVGDVSFDVSVSEVTVTVGTDVENVSFDVGISDLDITTSVDAGDVSLVINVPVIGTSSETPGDTVDAGNVNLAIVVPQISVTLIPPLEAPTNFRATSEGFDSITMGWNASTNAVSYEVQYRISGGLLVSVTDIAQTTYVFSNLLANSMYQFRIRARNDLYQLTSPWTSYVDASTTTLEVPTNLRSTSHGFDSITMSWNASANATAYDIQYRVSGGSLILISNVSVTSYVFSNLVASSTYQFRVRARNDTHSIVTLWTSFVSVDTTTLVLEAPQNMRVVVSTQTSIQVSWSRVNGATEYDVAITVVGGSRVATDNATTSTTYAFVGLTVATGYTIEIRASNNTHNISSDWSDIVTSTSAVTPLEDLFRVQSFPQSSPGATMTPAPAIDNLIPLFPDSNISSVPIMHIGDRTRISEGTTDSSGQYGNVVSPTKVSLGAVPELFIIYFGSTNYSSTNTGWQDLTVFRGGENSTDLLTLSVRRTDTTYHIRVLFGSSVTVGMWDVSDYLDNSFALRVVSGNVYDLYEATSGAYIGADVSNNRGFGTSTTDLIFNADKSKVDHILYISEENGTKHWYGGASMFIYESDPIIPTRASLIRGRDSQRQLTPPRVPAMQCLVWDEDGEIYYSRKFESGDACSLLAMHPEGYVKLMFTGLIDKVRYKYKESLYTYVVDAFGMSSRLIRDEVHGEILVGDTIARCIRYTLVRGGWMDTEDDSTNLLLTDSQFSKTLSYWWLTGEEAWSVINRLINTEGPPATFYEDEIGRLVFLGSGVDRVPSGDDLIPIGSGNLGNPLPVIGNSDEEFEANYVVNHASMEVVEYIEDDEYDTIWQRGTEFSILPGASYELTANFSLPIFEYENTTEPDFVATNNVVQVSFKDGELLSTRAVMVFDNTDGIEVVRIRNVEIQGKSLTIGSRVELSSDGIESATPSVSDSLDVYGRKEWSGRVYPTIGEDNARELVRSIVQNYHEGVDTFKIKIYANNYANLDRILNFSDVTTVRNSSVSASSIDPALYQTFVRKFTHFWYSGFHILGLEVESRSTTFFGVERFVIGMSATNSGRGYG